jgi:hypothetical protein
VSVNIHVSTLPPHYKITQTMIEDFLIDPVMGIKVIMGRTLDAFQANRVRTCWWTPNVIDSSGVGTGKTDNFFCLTQLRALLIGDQHGLVLYQDFDATKRFYWEKYRSIRSPIFQAQLGKVDDEGNKEGKSRKEGPSSLTAWFKNESMIVAPAPQWLQGAEGEAGGDMNWVLLDEWTKSARIGKDGNDGINKQILSRVRRQCFNQHHPLWANHVWFSASAESPSHPAYARYRSFEEEIARGNPNYALISYSYKDYSDLPTDNGKPFRERYRDEGAYERLRVQVTKTEFKRQALGLWAKETKGFYSEAALRKCVELGIAMGLEPQIARQELTKVLTE